MCKNYNYSYLRLDGKTQNEQRQKLVDKFNDPNNGDCNWNIKLKHIEFKVVIFLLSTKAGGVGLNLIGANRLILFDSDWFY